MFWTLKAHLVLCSVAYLVVLPLALVMELANQRYHSLAQLIGFLLAMVGMSFGWSHGHLDNPYARFGWYMLSVLLLQTALNFYLFFKRKFQMIYRAASVIQAISTYIIMLLGVIHYLSLCSNPNHIGQCVSHFARGSGLFLGSIALLVLLRISGSLMSIAKRPPELVISSLMLVVGLIGTFTEHNFLNQHSDGWSMKDLQHTMLGVLWLTGGILGVLMTYNKHPRDRCMVPALLFIVTGIVMAIHQQDSETSRHLHILFGCMMGGLGVSSIVEITLLSMDGSPKMYQYVTILLMCLSGLLLMGGNKGTVKWLEKVGVDVTTFGLTMGGVGFLVLWYFSVMVDLYVWLGGRIFVEYEEMFANSFK